MSYTRGPNPIWFFSDLVGQPVDDTYYAFFLENTLPYDFQPVYMTPNGTPWNNPIEFQPSSGLPNNLYFDPDAVYRIEIRQGDNQSEPLIYLIQNYTISGQGSVDLITLDSAENMITNPQFADTNFVSPLVVNTATTTSIAPGWDLVTTGSGSTTITKIPLAGTTHAPGNPPYYLQFDSNGWGSVKLIQRFTNNGALFGGGAIALTIDAMSVTSQQVLTVTYVPSVVNIPTPIFSNLPITVGALLEYKAVKNVDPSTNSDIPPVGYVDLDFTLPPNGIIALTNIQLTGQSTQLTNPDTFTAPSFQEQSYERIVDHEFHVYRDAMLRQPKDNIVVGWTFALNPWQFALRALTTVTVNQYTADQTIIVQQNYVANNVGSNVQVGQAAIADGYGLEVKALTATNQFAIIQYIEPTNMIPYWGDILSSMINAQVKTVNNTIPRFKMRLIYRTTTLPPIISRTEPIATWVSGADPAFAAGWTEIVPLNDPTYTLSSLPQNFPFDKFILPNVSNVTMTLGVVIYSVTDLVLTTTPDSIIFNKVSLIPNDFALEANIEDYQDTLRKCQYYYEQSFDQYYASKANQPGLVYQDIPYYQTSGGAYLLYKNSFKLVYKTIKRDVPQLTNSTLTFYSYDGTPGNVRLGMFDITGGGAGATEPGYNNPNGVGSIPPNPQNVPIAGNWGVLVATGTSIVFRPINISPVMAFSVVSTPFPGQQIQGDMYYQYIVDVRLGTY